MSLVRIGIDARKIHDFGIGTYIRNLLRGLAAIDQTTEYVLITRPEDMDVAASLGENFRAVSDRSGHYSLAEQISIPMAARRERLDLLHAPHYVLPALTPTRAVVTIHDCIHLMFPDHLQHRLAYSFAKALLYTAAHKSDRIFTVSEQSKRDILKFFDVRPDKIVVTPNAIDDRFNEPPTEEHAREIIIAFIQRQPGDWVAATGNPFTDNRGLPKAGGG
jgi:glycosyltransferase involved in cell wall biosynthesis